MITIGVATHRTSMTRYGMVRYMRHGSGSLKDLCTSPASQPSERRSRSISASDTVFVFVVLPKSLWCAKAQGA